MFKDDRYYLTKMESNVDFIIAHMKSVIKETLEADPVLLDSMMLRLVQISENSKSLSEEFRQNNEDIPWSDIYGLRNRIVHDYGNVDIRIIYETLTNDITDIKHMIERARL